MKQYTKELLGLILFFVLIWLGTTLYLDYQKDIENKASASTNDDADKNVAPEDLSELIENLIFSETDTIMQPDLQKALESILFRLAKADTDSTYDETYKIKVIANEQVNAFATLNGKMYLTSGLINASTNPEVVAAVIAHEMGHIKYQHFKKNLQREFGLQTIVNILTGGNHSLSIELGKSIMQSHYSREQEEACDAFATEVLQKASIHPHRLSEAFLIIKNQYGEHTETSGVLGLFHSHPALRDRIRDNVNMQVDSGFIEQPFDLDWLAIKSLSGLQ